MEIFELKFALKDEIWAVILLKDEIWAVIFEILQTILARYLLLGHMTYKEEQYQQLVAR